MSDQFMFEIDLSKTTKDGGAGLKVGPSYVVLYNGRWYRGTFEKQWYGLNFLGIYPSGAQYDPPLENFSSWQKIYRVADDPKLKNRSADALLMMSGLDPDKIAEDEEIPFATRRKEYAIKHKLTSKGKALTEKTPLKHFYYIPSPIDEDEDGD